MDYYSILGLKREAPQGEIKKAYSRLAKEHHPDKNNGESSPEFLEITEAYEVLSNTEDKAFYDAHGFRASDPNQIINKAQDMVDEKVEETKAKLKALVQNIDKLKAPKYHLKSKEPLYYNLKEPLYYNLIGEAYITNINNIIGEAYITIINNKEFELKKVQEALEVTLLLKEALSKYERGKMIRAGVSEEVFGDHSSARKYPRIFRL